MTRKQVYTVLVVAHMYEPSVLNIIYPLSVFGYALLQNPRSLPRIGGSLMHPMIQNPPRLYWNFLLVYAFSMLVIKFIFQFPLFCVCGNHYSMGQSCPSSLLAYRGVCAEKTYPHLDYYIDQPIVKDYFVGLFKAYRSLSWNQMSVRYEPVNRYLPPDPPGMVSSHDAGAYVPLSIWLANAHCTLTGIRYYSGLWFGWRFFDFVFGGLYGLTCSTLAYSCLENPWCLAFSGS